MVVLGETLADRLIRSRQPQGSEPLLVSLSGDLGAGKSVLVRAMLRRLGYTGPVKSPTFTLVETYTLDGGAQAAHLDLYRLADPEEIEYIGFRDLLDSCDWLFIEWPEKGEGLLPAATLVVHIAYPPVQDGAVSCCRSVRLDATIAGLLDGL